VSSSLFGSSNRVSPLSASRVETSSRVRTSFWYSWSSFCALARRSLNSLISLWTCEWSTFELAFSSLYAEWDRSSSVSDQSSVCNSDLVRGTCTMQQIEYVRKKGSSYNTGRRYLSSSKSSSWPVNARTVAGEGFWEGNMDLKYHNSIVTYLRTYVVYQPYPLMNVECLFEIKTNPPRRHDRAYLIACRRR